MTKYYVRSTDGVSGDSGLTWALAKAKATDLASFAAGDIFNFSQLHAETNTGAHYALVLPGTLANPVQVICTNDSAEPPTALATGASIETTGVYDVRISGHVYWRGVNITAGDGVQFSNIFLNFVSAGRQEYESCDLYVRGAHSSGTLVIGSATAANSCHTRLKNCRLRMSQTAQTVFLNGVVDIKGMSFISGTTINPVGFFAASSGVGCVATFRDTDFTVLGTGTWPIVQTPVSSRSGSIRFFGGKIASGWTGNLVAGTSSSPNFRVEMYDFLVGTSRIFQWIEDAYGTARDSQTIYRTGGAVFSSLPASIKMTTSANSKFPLARFESNPISVAYPGTDAEVAAFVPGTSKTVSVEFVHDTNVAAGQGAGASFAFQNDEFALEVQTLDSAGSVMTTTTSSIPADVLTAATDIPSSSVAWTTTGLTTVVKQKLSVTVAPQVAGSIVARIIGYKTGKTIYYCPKLTVV